MKCTICGATCRCKKAGPGICCSCHKHKAGQQAHDEYNKRQVIERFQTKIPFEVE